MKKIVAILLFAISLTFSGAPCLADGKKDHVCFKELDSNKDGLVTFQEFQKVYGNDNDKFNAADTDADGKLTHDEYHNFLGHGSS